MRLDKFLKVSRILKRRTLAQDACDMGKVSVNGRPGKPGHKLKVGDVVEATVISVDVKKNRIGLSLKSKPNLAAAK